MRDQFDPAFHAILTEDWGDLKPLARAIRRPYATLLREVNPHDAGAKLGAADYLSICTVTPRAMEFGCRLAGYAAVDVREIEARLADQDPGALHSTMSIAVQELGDVARQLGADLADGYIDDAELAAMERECWEAVEAVFTVLLAARRNNQEGR